MKKPRVIRKVVKRYKTGGALNGKPKSARDYNTGMWMERINPQSIRPCRYRMCPMQGTILPGTPYARLTAPGYEKRIGHRYVPDPRDYHFDCVPPEARPLVRFLMPQPWIAKTWIGTGDPRKGDGEMLVRRFTSPEAWLAWTDHNFPSMRKTFHIQTNEFEQVGTNNHWSHLSRAK